MGSSRHGARQTAPDKFATTILIPKASGSLLWRNCGRVKVPGDKLRAAQGSVSGTGEARVRGDAGMVGRVAVRPRRGRRLRRNQLGGGLPTGPELGRPGLPSGHTFLLLQQARYC